MKDQAELLRHRMKEREPAKQARTIAIASGKGGVGKSNFCLNFALQLTAQQKRVLIFDLDIGMGNIDILMGKTPAHTFVDLFRGNKSIHDIIELGPESLSYIAGGSGLSQIFHLDHEKFLHFQKEFEKLMKSYDYILFDMGAGATDDSLNFIASAQEAIVVTTPEPTSITDGYAMIKHLVKKEEQLPISVLVNRSLHDKSGRQTFERLQMVVRKFLGTEITFLGTIPDDRAVLQAVNRQKPFVLDHPTSKASRSLKNIAAEYIKGDVAPDIPASFMEKLKRFVFER
ncbi:flagellar biosynthesis protein FlhG [Halobacillus dabanensis]|uniref:Flagellar biosynthesis protein FlhG n=1 Tax=Halobacillus dabanensis TaxID=240302 RepID=A0A1I3Y5S4_HALDA|nr:MinD/ParA family protein [Halobacillus dabanensis]SFK27198.1 flagellar biosynthesis protein FlhG [Halobacillus dabanensis]